MRDENATRTSLVKLMIHETIRVYLRQPWHGFYRFCGFQEAFTADSGR